MIYLLHLFRWTKNLIRFPLQFFLLLFNDIKKDHFSNLRNNKNKFILVIGVPKSGTTFIEEILSAAGYVDLSSSFLRIFDNRNLKNPHDISDSMFKFVPKNKYTFIKVHAHFSDSNFKVIEKYKPKVIISTRELKNILISRYCHIISDRKHRHHKEIVNLETFEGIKKSLIMKNSFDTPIKPLDYFFYWITDWFQEIKKRNLNYLILRYEDIKKDKNNYVTNILNYLNIKNISSNDILKKLKKNSQKNKKSLNYNLNSYIKPKTFNKDSDIIRSKIDMSALTTFIDKNIPKKNR